MKQPPGILQYVYRKLALYSGFSPKKLYCMQIVWYPRYTFQVIVQLILILYFQKGLEYLSSPQICHYQNTVIII